jgi:hypothetical protein
MRHVLKLGGENYSYDNLRRDILSIEEDDQTKYNSHNPITSNMSDQCKVAELAKKGKPINLSVQPDRPTLIERILEDL